MTGRPRSQAAQALADEIAAAHGGLERWRRAGAVEVRFASGGLAFAAKGQAATLLDVTGRFAVADGDVALNGSHPKPWVHRFEGAADVAAVLARLPVGPRRLRWSRHDLAGFAAAAMWTYLSLPFALGDARCQLEMLPDLGERRRLAVTFPPDAATHCRRQVVHVDAAGLIRRHDYTALAFGGWARAAQSLGAYRDFDGLRVATRRRVTPRLGRRALPGPTLVWIGIADVTTAPAPPLPPRASAGRS